MRRIATISFPMLCAALLGCAQMIPQTPAELTPVEATSQQPASIRLRQSVEVKFNSGYGRNLTVGSEWHLVGKVPQGAVYRAVGSVFTIEGAQVHEAYLVIAEGMLVGFYLPGESMYSILSSKISLLIGGQS